MYRAQRVILPTHPLIWYFLPTRGCSRGVHFCSRNRAMARFTSKTEPHRTPLETDSRRAAISVASWDDVRKLTAPPRRSAWDVHWAGERRNAGSARACLYQPSSVPWVSLEKINGHEY